MGDCQKVFAERIDMLGKQLFEPQHGGSYEVFQTRPLNPVILAYAAHDVRYMLTLYEWLTNNIFVCSGPHDPLAPGGWIDRVRTMSSQRASWCQNTEYVQPSSEAPEF